RTAVATRRIRTARAAPTERTAIRTIRLAADQVAVPPRRTSAIMARNAVSASFASNAIVHGPVRTAPGTMAAASATAVVTVSISTRTGASTAYGRNRR